MKSKIYKALSLSNDITSIFNGRLLQRLWNKTLLKLVRGFMK